MTIAAFFVAFVPYLKAGKGLQVTESAGRVSLLGVDPLYGRVLVEQAGRFLVGAVRFTEPVAARRLVEQVIKRAGVKESKKE